jgi:hypothetical protein
MRTSRLRASRKISFQSSALSLMPCQGTCCATSVSMAHIFAFCGSVLLGAFISTRVPSGAFCAPMAGFLAHCGIVEDQDGPAHAAALTRRFHSSQAAAMILWVRARYR